MDTFEELKSARDTLLLSRILANPESREARVAETLLQFRRYRAEKRLNLILLILTAVIAASAVSDLFVRITLER